MSYDGASYKYMLANDIPPCPVITFVLNFSMQRWSTSKSILDCLSINNKLKPFIKNYEINVIDVAYLSRDTINKFKSDFKIIADYFVQMRETGEYEPMTDEIKHIWELLLLMGNLADDDRFKVEYYRTHREERANMCEVLDKVENRGIEKGITEGEHKRAISGAIRMIRRGKDTLEEIADIMELSLEEVTALSKEIKAVSV